MRKNFIFVASLTAILIFLVYACTHEEVENPFDEQKEQLIEDAMRIYYCNTVEDGLITMRSTAEHEGVLVKPAWEYVDMEEDKEQLVLNIGLRSE